MRILVAGAFDPAQNWAHAVNTITMAQAFAQRGHDVTVVCWRPDGGAWSQEKFINRFGHTVPMRWVQLPKSIAGRPLDDHWHFGLLALPALFRCRPHLVFSRSYIFPFISSWLGFVTVVESHAHPDNTMGPFQRLARGAHHRALRLWVTISENLAEAYRGFGVPADKLAVLPTGGDYQLFRRPARLPPTPYPPGGKVVAYSGHLYDHKGIPTVLEAARKLPEAQFHLIGGWPEDVERQSARAKEMTLTNVTFHGLKDVSEVPPFLWHADVLLLPPTASHPSAAWTAPIKLAEYMASETPIVATSIPGLRAWVGEDEVEFVAPDDSDALVSGIRTVLSGGALVENRRKACLAKARAFSSEERAAAILSGIGVA